MGWLLLFCSIGLIAMILLNAFLYVENVRTNDLLLKRESRIEYLEGYLEQSRAKTN